MNKSHSFGQLRQQALATAEKQKILKEECLLGPNVGLICELTVCSLRKSLRRFNAHHFLLFYWTMGGFKNVVLCSFQSNGFISSLWGYNLKSFFIILWTVDLVKPIWDEQQNASVLILKRFVMVVIFSGILCRGLNAVIFFVLDPKRFGIKTFQNVVNIFVCFLLVNVNVSNQNVPKY